MENTNNKSKRSIALLLALCMLTSFCSYTIAKYMTIGEGNDFARVAKWGITFDKGSSEMFATTYNTGVDGKGTKVVAPGTSGSGTYILEGTPETAYEITFNTEGTSEVFLGKGDWKYVDTEGYSDLMNYNNSETGTNKIYYPVKYTVTLANTVGTVSAIDNSLDVLAENTPTVFDSFAEAAKIINNTKVTFNPNEECDAKITVDWAWAFDGQNDAADTILGDLVAKNPDLTNVATAQEGTDYNVNISYKFAMTAKQLELVPNVLSRTFKNEIPNDSTTLIFDTYNNHVDLGTSTASTFSLEPATLNAELDDNSENNENTEENEIQLLNEVTGGIPVDEDGKGTIQLFIDNKISYILSMDSMPIYAPENSSDLFSGLNNITTMNLETLDTSKVTNMDNMFKDCKNLETIFIADKWDINKVKTSTNMFTGSNKLDNYDNDKVDINKANKDGYLTDINSLIETNTISKTLLKSNLSGDNLIFDKYSNYSDIVNLENGINVDEKETGSIKLFKEGTDIYVLSMNDMAIYAPEDCSSLFKDVSLKTINFNNFNTSNVTNMGAMFYENYYIKELDLNSFDTSNVTNMSSMFGTSPSFIEIKLDKWNTSNVTNMSGMFWNCINLTNLEVSNFNTSNVINMRQMFSGCSSLTSLDVSNFDTSNVEDMYYMFYNYKGTFLDVSNFDTTNVTNMNSMFLSCSKLTTLDVSNFNTSNVTDMNCMFRDCNALKILDLSNFNTSNVTDMGSMFSGCANLTSLNLSNFNTSNVRSMSNMFNNISIKKLDISSFNTSNVTNMGGMFSSCKNLTTIYVSENWNTDKVTTSSNMFANCLNIKGENDTIYNSSYKDKTYARIDNPPDEPGYLTLKTN